MPAQPRSFVPDSLIEGSVEVRRTRRAGSARQDESYVTGRHDQRDTHECDWRQVIERLVTSEPARVAYGPSIIIDHIEAEKGGRFFYLKGIRIVNESVFRDFQRAFPGTECGQKDVQVTELSGIRTQRPLLYIFVPNSLSAYRQENLLERATKAEIIGILCIIACLALVVVSTWNHWKDYESPFKSLIP